MTLVQMNILFFLFIELWIIFYVSAKRVPNSVAEFPFLRQESLKNEFNDLSTTKSIGFMSYSNRNNSKTYPTLNSNGVYSMDQNDFIASVGNISALVSQIQSSSFTMEMWLQINNTKKSNLPIISITSSSKSSDCHNYFMVTQETSSISNTIGISIQSCTKSNTITTITPTMYIPMNTSRVAHLVIVVSYVIYPGPRNTFIYETDVNYTVNGKFVGSTYELTDSVSFYASDWDQSSKLYFFSNPYSSSYWDGKLFYFAMYPMALTSSEIIQNYESKIPFSSPIVNSFSVIIQEEGEVGDHSNDPSFYLSPIPSNELDIIELTAYSFDETIASPNYNRTNEYLEIEIVKPPSVGILYYLNGTALDFSNGNSVSISKNLSTGLYSVRYRPPSGAYSILFTEPYATISFQAVLHEASMTIVSLTQANVSVIIQHVDKPPKVLSDTPLIISADTLTKIIMTGTPDKGSSIIGIRIITLPKHGTLTRVLAYNGTYQITVGSFVSGLTSATVNYITSYSGFGPVDEITGITGNDSYTYEAVDIYSRYSVPGTISMSIHTPIYANPSSSTSPNTIEGICSAIKLYASDTSTVPNYLRLALTSLPTHGFLYTNSSCDKGQRISIPQILPTLYSYNEYTHGVILYYMSDESFFNYPTTNYDNVVILSSVSESLTYRMFANDSTLSSAQATQRIYVKNFNHPTDINFTYTGEWANGISIYAFDSYPKPGQVVTAVIDGFKLFDPDHGVDPVRVTINIPVGPQLSLNPNYISKIQLNTGLCYKLNSFVCLGSGYDDVIEVTFIAQPSDAQNVLNGMSIISYFPDQSFIVNITVYDGANGNCISGSNLDSSKSYRPTCYERSTSFQVNVLSYSGYSIEDVYSSQSVSPTESRVYIVSYVILGIMCCLSIKHMCGKAKRFLSRLLFGDETTGKKGILSANAVATIRRRTGKFLLDVDHTSKNSDILPNTTYYTKMNHPHCYETPENKNKVKFDEIYTSSTIHTNINHMEMGESPARSNGTKDTDSPRLSRNKFHKNQKITSPLSVKSSRPLPSPFPNLMVDDWKIYRAKNGRPFYHNHKTKVSTWYLPTSASVAASTMANTTTNVTASVADTATTNTTSINELETKEFME